MKSRINYSFVAILIIILGILSRKFSFIPLCVGDMLYAVLIYFVLRTISPNQSKSQAALIALLLCYVIEISQLHKGNWLVEIRQTLLGHYILGHGFLWSDMAAYTLGVFVAFLFDKYILKFH